MGGGGGGTVGCLVTLLCKVKFIGWALMQVYKTSYNLIKRITIPSKFRSFLDACISITKTGML